MALLIKVLVAKSNDLGSSPGTQMVERENSPKLSSDSPMYAMAYIQMDDYSKNKFCWGGGGGGGGSETRLRPEH